MVSRLKCQFNKHRIRFDNILKRLPGGDCWNQNQAHKAGNETELTEREEPERERPETITPKPVLKSLGPQPRHGQGRRRCTSRQPSSAKTDALQKYGCVHIWLGIPELSRHSEAIHYQPPEELRVAILVEIDEAEG